MVELFSFSGSGNTLNVTLTTNELQNFKQYAKEYSFFIFETSGDYVSGDDKQYDGTVTICTPRIITEAIEAFENNYKYERIYLNYTTNVQIWIYAASGTFQLRFRPSSDNNTKTIIGKVYGIK